MGIPIAYPQNRFKNFQKFFPVSFGLLRLSAFSFYPEALFSSLLWQKLRCAAMVASVSPSWLNTALNTFNASSSAVCAMALAAAVMAAVSSQGFIFRAPFPAGCNIRPPLFILSYASAPGLAASLCFRRFPPSFVL
jgi:hypothetical protein